MKNLIIVPFDLNTARKIKSGEIEGSVLIDNIEIEFVYESKDCADRYNLLFVKKDGSGIYFLSSHLSIVLTRYFSIQKVVLLAIPLWN